jgi:hypothetical protein
LKKSGELKKKSIKFCTEFPGFVQGRISGFLLEIKKKEK